LLVRSGAPAVPAFIEGAFEALPRGRRVPTVHQITVVFGHPEPVDVLRVAGTGRTDEERIASALRQRVAALAGTSLTTPGQATAVLAEDEADSIRR
jgi:long-chain acyl-CoA synthetase